MRIFISEGAPDITKRLADDVIGEKAVAPLPGPDAPRRGRTDQWAAW